MGMCLGKIQNDVIEKQNYEINQLRTELAKVQTDLHTYLKELALNNEHIARIAKEKCQSSQSLADEIEQENKNIDKLRKSVDKMDYYNAEDDHE
jgi:methyl-accepting chemotaxis protein